MMRSSRQKLIDDQQRQRIRGMYLSGYSMTAIAKSIGKSYRYVQMITGQEFPDEQETESSSKQLPDRHSQ
jgi:hypothetical protein